MVFCTLFISYFLFEHFDLTGLLLIYYDFHGFQVCVFMVCMYVCVCLSTCTSIFHVFFFVIFCLVVCFLKRDLMELEGWGGTEDTGGDEGRETDQDILYEINYFL